jgi:hypothetical protein
MEVKHMQKPEHSVDFISPADGFDLHLYCDLCYVLL